MAASQSSADRSPLPAQVVGNAFVQQYYHILQQSPELIHRFYQESSELSRPDAHGTLSSVTTTDAINQKILSMGFVRAETKTVDAQDSLAGGVIVLVTGHLIGEDNVKRDFTQSFFLAPQDKGFYVLNDILRYVEQLDHEQEHQRLPNGTGAPHAPESDLAPEEDQHVQEPTVDEEEVNEEEVYNPSENPSENGDIVDEEEEPTSEVINEVPNNSEPSDVCVPEEIPKKSYASIVKVMKDSASVSVPARAPQRPMPIKPEPQSASIPAAVPASAVPASSYNPSGSNSTQETEADGYSIYVKSLPLDAIPAQLEEEFKQFGPIKPGGIQVRSHKLQGFCFGFVEFEVADAVQSAIQASPIMIGGRPAYVEEKRAATSRVSGRGRFVPGRGAGFQSDARGRGNYGGGRGYGRGDFNTRPNYGGRGNGRGGSLNRFGDGYPRADYMVSPGGHGSRNGGT